MPNLEKVKLIGIRLEDKPQKVNKEMMAVQ